MTYRISPETKRHFLHLKLFQPLSHHDPGLSRVAT